MIRDVRLGFRIRIYSIPDPGVRKHRISDPDPNTALTLPHETSVWVVRLICHTLVLAEICSRVFHSSGTYFGCYSGWQYFFSARISLPTYWFVGRRTHKKVIKFATEKGFEVLTNLSQIIQKRYVHLGRSKKVLAWLVVLMDCLCWWIYTTCRLRQVEGVTVLMDWCCLWIDLVDRLIMWIFYEFIGLLEWYFWWFDRVGELKVGWIVLMGCKYWCIDGVDGLIGWRLTAW